MQQRQPLYGKAEAECLEVRETMRGDHIKFGLLLEHLWTSRRTVAAVTVICLCVLAQGCRDKSAQSPLSSATTHPAQQTGHQRKQALQPRPRRYKVVHVFVALCDNRNQGIVPVREALGNGQDPRNNLYWGAMYGVKTFFRRSNSWSVVRHTTVPLHPVLDRVVFRSTWSGQRVYVIADAYDGAMMKAALTDFMTAARGAKIIEVSIDADGADHPLQGGALADMVCFVGHNGLMDVSLDAMPSRPDGSNPTGAIVLACKSFSYFNGPLQEAGCPLLLATTGLMAPEAYTLDAALRSWAAGQTPQQIRQEAARSYAKYQRCSQRAALRLFTCGK